MTFQYPMGGKTLFAGVNQLEPAHAMLVTRDGLKIWRYWDIHYHLDFDNTPDYFEHRLQELMDVDIGAYVSGGVDSSLIGVLACAEKKQPLPYFHGRFLEAKAYDESDYAEIAAKQTASPLFIRDISSQDFIQSLDKIIYHMDFPVAGPGVFPQYIVSEMAAQKVKVVLGGQGGDELFGGYARYLIAYFEQTIKGAIEGTNHAHPYVVTAESIIPNLEMLKQYQPMLKQFFSQGLFESLDKRYYRLVNRAVDAQDEVFLSEDEQATCFEWYAQAFNFPKFEKAESYFNAMTHFDLKCLLPGLLHVEDRVSMAHGLESRVPFLYWPLVEFVASIPATIKFSGGRMKHLLLNTFSKHIPPAILQRKDKMGFPVPLTEWMQGDLKAFIFDILNSGANRNQGYIDYQRVLSQYENTQTFSRKMWGFLCYELWMQQFHDKAQRFRECIF